MKKFHLIAAFLFGLASSAYAAPMLVVSIDGFRASDAQRALKGELKMPNVVALMKEGAYATGVRNVLPTVTYPDHTTLITGVWPREHGIVNNSPNDPQGKNVFNQYLYAADIKAPTLWDAAHGSGKKVASLYWPVSAGARSVDYLIPDIGGAKTPMDAKLVEALSSPGLVDELSAASGVSLLDTLGEDGAAEEVQSDAAKVKFAAALLERKHPDLMLVHVVSTDHAEHAFGPDSAQAVATFEKVDAIVGKFVADARKANPDLVVAIVSDHGFQAVDGQTNLGKAFIDEGLAKLDPKTGKLASWDAWASSAGGSAPIYLSRPDDKALVAKVGALLKKLQARPELNIARVIDAKTAEKLGAGSGPSFWVEMKPGTMVLARTSGPETGPPLMKGMHGYFPDRPQMHSVFILVGPGLKKKGSLGEIDMRAIAPTVAKIMGVPFPSAQAKPLF